MLNPTSFTPEQIQDIKGLLNRGYTARYNNPDYGWHLCKQVADFSDDLTKPKDWIVRVTPIVYPTEEDVWRDALRRYIP